MMNYSNLLIWDEFFKHFPYYLILQFVWFIREYNKVKYYIVNIHIDENIILIKYYKWFRLCEIKEEIANVSMKLDQVRSIRLRIFVNGKRIITQFEQSFFSKSKWNPDLLKEVESKLKPYLKIQKTL